MVAAVEPTKPQRLLTDMVPEFHNIFYMFSSFSASLKTPFFKIILIFSKQNELISLKK
jgi:hypothetical protein